MTKTGKWSHNPPSTEFCDELYGAVNYSPNAGEPYIEIWQPYWCEGKSTLDIEDATKLRDWLTERLKEME